MPTYIARRTGWAAVTIFLAVTFSFALFFVVPGGRGREGPGGISPVAVLLAGRNAPPRAMRQIERELGLDRPLLVQYGLYVSGLARGDLGFSFAAGAPVRSVIAPAIPPSVSIAVGASLLWVAAGVAIGVTSARRRGSWTDRLMMLGALAALSMPVFVVALVGLAIVLRSTGIYAGNRYVALTDNPIGWLEAMWLPWICLAFPHVAVYARMVRNSLLEVGGEDYIRTSWAKGLDDEQVMRHQLRAGLAPIVTLYGLDFPLLVAGSVIIESIFRIPGLGSLLLQSQTFYDFPVMSAVVIVLSVAVVVANLVVDIAYHVIDPRVNVVTSPGALG